MTISRTTIRGLESKTRASGARAFTLIELLVVAAVVACLAALAVPYTRGSHQTARIRDAALTLGRLIEHGRALAVHRGRPVRLTIDREQNRCRLEQAAALDSLEYESLPGHVGEWLRLSAPIRFVHFGLEGLGDDSVGDVVFSPDGRWPHGRISVGTDETRVDVTFGHGRGDVRVSKLMATTDPVSDQDRTHDELLANPLQGVHAR